MSELLVPVFEINFELFTTKLVAFSSIPPEAYLEDEF